MIKASKKIRYLFSILSGILLVLSFPFTGSLTPLAFVAWVPILLVEDQIHNQRYRSGKVFIHAYLTFFIYNIGTTWWVYNASPEGSLMAFFANTLLMTVVFYFFHLTKKYVGKKEGFIALIIYWVGFEYFHYNWESSWPWLTLGNVFSIRTTWVQWYSFTGALGGSIWILIINLLAFRVATNVFVKKETWRIQTPIFYLLVAFLVIPIATSLFSFFSYEEAKRPMEVVVVQPNIDPYEEKFNSSVFGQLDKTFDLAKKAVTSKTELIVAPETAIWRSFDEAAVNNGLSYANNIRQYLIQQKQELNNASICIGASTHRLFKEKNSIASFPLQFGNGFYENYNTSVLLNNKDELSFVHKSKLVPGVEKIPFASTFSFLEDLAIDLGGTSGTLGTENEPQVLTINGSTFAPVICYESAFGEFVSIQCRKGAEFICIITNDGWWRDTPGYKQHMSFASLRAIENRRDVVRSANTGVSCFVDQRGTIIQPTPWWKEAVIRGSINLNSELSFYSKYGDFFGRSFAFVAILLLLYTFVKRFRKIFGK